jgi:hypothetical protein
MNRVSVFLDSCGDGLLICYESIEMCAQKTSVEATLHAVM